MPLLETIEMTPTGKNFTVATAFMRNEQATTYIWTTNQVESEHSVMKLWLSTYHGDLDTVFLNIDSLIEGQIGRIKTSLEFSRLKDKFNTKSNPILKNISNNISNLALKKIWIEIKRLMVVVDIELWWTLCSGIKINGLRSLQMRDGCPLPHLHVQWCYHRSDRNTRYRTEYPPEDLIHVNL
ncbi:hypothetical protein M9H77_18697 [Catharanthus roseus]|uniref:Uncharacterized protein n=1 Tax=Catharanthus roseus TaxID=4058 RepID=A0ACC0B875_CATRO|nr:hypothetical protein M9H77_18697 [Catharanthus roseus]